MIDRAARNDIIAAIEEFLDDKIMAFEFDDRIQSPVILLLQGFPSPDTEIVTLTKSQTNHP